MISAIVLVKCDVSRIPEAAQQIADLEGVTDVYSVTGDIDLIAVVKVPRHEDLHDVIADQLNKVPGVLETTTHISFRTYTGRDLAAGFDIGLAD